MDLQKIIIKGIKEQLYSNNYLVLPGFGGFVLKSVPAHFGTSGSVLLPPSKLAGFNAQLKQNDGILVLWLQEQLNCSPAEALTHIRDFSEYCQSILNARRRFTLDGIGFFYLDFENNIRFEPQPDSNFQAESYGLMPVAAIPIETEKNISRNEDFRDRTSEMAYVKLHPNKQKRNYRKIVISGLAIMFAFAMLFLLVSKNSFKGELYASLFNYTSKATYQPLDYSDLNLLPLNTQKESFVTDANGIGFIELDATKSIPVKVVESTVFKTNTVKIPLNKVAATGKFKIVLGAFEIYENALKHAKNLSHQGTLAGISGKNAKGMYIVSHGRFMNKEEAAAQLKVLKSEFPNAWIFSGE